MNTDGLYHISLMGGQARAILVDSTQLVQRAKDVHGLSRIATAALGRTLTAAVMMGSMRKGENESVSTHTIETFCRILDCRVEDIMEYIKEEQ